MNLHTDLYRATPPAAVATVPRRRRGTAFVAVSLVALLCIGVGVAAAALVADGSGSVARPSTAAAPVTVAANACGPEIDNLLATIKALPPAVVANLSPRLAHVVEASVIYNQSLKNLPASDAAIIGRVLAQLDLADRNVIMAALPVGQQPAVAAAEMQAAADAWVTGAVAVCF